MEERRQEDSDGRDNLEYLFESALALPDNEREPWLVSQCHGTSEEVQQKVHQVVTLLASHEKAEGFLSQSASEDIQAPFPDFSGQTVGNYKIDHLIGKGGMGRIYLAHRIDGEFQKQVAIKFVESLHIDNELFKRERQILADLDISNVVSLLDGGTTDNGYLYIVMEYIDGVPIDTYVRKHQLNEQHIIQLLINLADIVHKANNCGVIHCDLKPGNVLVTSEGVLKLLDFGISRMTNHAFQTKFDANLSKAMTLEYASPQRCQKHIPTITDDVYSLGIIMGVLLIDQQPVLISDVAQGVQGVRHTSVEAYSDQINDTELRAIFTKATASDAEARYPSAHAFAADLQRKLDNGLVSVLSHQLSYRFAKTLRRDWATFMVLGLLLLLLISLPFMIIIYQQKNKDAMEANNVLTNMIENMGLTFQKYHTDPLFRKKQIDFVIKQTQGHKSTEINTNLAKLYVLMGEVSGHPYAISESNLEDSKLYYGKATKLYKSLIDEREDTVKAVEDFTRARRHLAVIKAYDGQMEEGLVIIREIQKTLETIYWEHGVPDVEQFHLGLYAMTEAFGEMHQQHYEKADKLLDHAVIYLFSDIENREKYPAHLAFYYELRGHLALLQKKPSMAKKQYQKVIVNYASQPTKNWRIRRSIARAQQGMGCLSLRENNLKVGIQHFHQARNIYLKLSEKQSYVNSVTKRKNEFEPLDNRKITKSIHTLKQSMNCDNPLKFILPPRH